MFTLRRLFISYRRDPDRAEAKLLRDALAKAYCARGVFLDADAIPDGVPFEAFIKDKIRASDVFLVLIGKNWTDLKDRHGVRRLHDPDDLLRQEIETALATPGMRVVPVIIDPAPDLDAADLRDSLKPLAQLHARRRSILKPQGSVCWKRVPTAPLSRTTRADWATSNRAMPCCTVVGGTFN